MSYTIRHAYGPRNQVVSTFTKPTMTKQSFKAECDINNIMARYQKTGVVDHFNRHSAHYGDYDAITFTEAQYMVAEAQTMFNELPARAREHFNHSPAEFLEFVNDPETKTSDLTALGLAHATLDVPLATATPIIKQPPETGGKSASETSESNPTDGEETP